MTRHSMLMAGSAALALAAFVTTPARAQEQSAQVVALEEIVVTAQRREQNLQQTPVAVTAFTASELEKIQVTKMVDLSNRAPNLILSNASASPATVRPFMRGAGQNDNTIPTGEQSVGFYVDDIYQARANGLNLEFFDIERIEILRGPQGTLYGRNTAVGAIKVVSKVPDGSTYGKFEASYGRYETYTVRGTAGFGLVEDKLSASLSAMYSDADGDRFNTTLNRKVNARKFGGVRGVLHYTPTDNLDVVFRLFWTKDDNEHNSVAPSDPVTGLPLTGSLFRTRVPFVPFGLTKQAGFSTKVTYDINEDWSLSYIAGHLNLTDQSDADVSGGVPGPGGAFISAFRIRTGFNNHQTSNELQLTGSAMDGKLDLTAGVFYFKETNTNILTNTLFGGASINTSGADLVTNNYAAFGQITYHVTDQLGLTVGGRISEDKKKADFRIASVRPPSPTATVIREDDFKEFTPKFGVDYQATNDMLLFVSASKGFKAGGYNGRGNTPLVINIPFNEEIVWTYEAGIKTEFADNRVRVNAGYFYNDFSDLQLQAFLNAPGVPPGTVVTSNSGTAKVDGLEVELTAAATENLTLNAALATMWGKYKKVDPTSDVARNNATDIPTTPKFQASFGFDWAVPVPDVDGTVVFGGNFMHRASYYPGLVQNTNNLTPAIDLVDAYVGWEHEDGHFSINLAGKNLLNEKYQFTTLFIAGFINGKYPAERLGWRLSAKYTY